MTSNPAAGNRIVGTLRTADGTGVVRMKDRFDTDIDDLWSALTDPGRLARWIGEFEGDLRLGGEYRARFFDGWEGTGRVDVCEPPRHLLVTTKHVRQATAQVVEATLTADGDHTILVLEERGMPVNLLAEYGAGIQVHIEDLAAHIAGRERCDTEARWAELQPSYEALASELG
ncbi:MAG: SRPBCC family protein [Streptosporangiaceae bacterium]